MLFVSYRLLVLFGESLVIFIINDIVRRWRGLSCFLGVSVGAPWKWDKACRRQRVDHFRGTLHWHTGTEPLEPTPRFPSCSQTCARATSPNHFVTLFVRDKYLLAAYEMLQMFFESIPTQDFAFAILVSAELILKQNVIPPFLCYDMILTDSA